MMWPFRDKKQKLERAKLALSLAKRTIAEIELKIKNYPTNLGVSSADFLKTNAGKILLNELKEAKRELLIAKTRIEELEL